MRTEFEPARDGPVKRGGGAINAPTFWGWHAGATIGIRRPRRRLIRSRESLATPRAVGARVSGTGRLRSNSSSSDSSLALMPRPLSSATFEVVSTFAIIGGLLYFAFWGVTVAVRGKSRGSAAAVPGPGVVPVRFVRLPARGGGRFSNPDTLRGIPLRQRFSELTLSLTYAALSTVLDRGRVVLGDRAIHRLVAGRTIRRHAVGRLVAHPGAGEVHGGDRHGRRHARVALVLSGLAIGGVSLWLNQQLVATPPTTDQYHAAHVAFDHIGPHDLVEAGSKGQPSTLGYMVFFGGLLALQRWWRQADSFRRKRLAIWAIIPSSLVGLAITMLFPFPTVWGTIWAAALSATVQFYRRPGAHRANGSR